MLDLFKGILEVAKSLLGMSDQLKSAKHQRKADMAVLFEKISTCLLTVSSEIRLGNIPHGKCGELSTYAEALPDAIRDEVGVDKATHLGDLLHSAHNVEGMAMDIDEVADKEPYLKEPYLKEVEEASGKFQALANLLRAR